MHNTYKENGLDLIAIYGIANEKYDTEEQTREFAEKHNYVFPVFFDDDNQLVNRYGVKGFPAAFIVNAEREVIWKGDPRKKTVEEKIRRHLSLPTQDQDSNSSSDSEQEQLVPYEGRTEFKLLAKDQPAIRGVQAGSIKDVRRYDLPFYAAAPEAGQVVADVGCGKGKFSFKLAKVVGEDGKVYCRDISQGSINSINQTVEQQEVSNIDAQVSEKDDVLLPEATIDLTLLSDVYQFVVHQKAQEGFIGSLYRATKPGGIVVVTHVTTHLLNKEDDWQPYFDRTIEDFTAGGFEPGQRWILDDKDDKRPILILEFRRPLDKDD